MKVTDPKKATLSLIYDELIRLEGSINKYTNNSIFDFCTKFGLDSEITDTELKNCLFLAQNLESYIINLGGDWPDNKILKRKVIKLREQWQSFVENNGQAKCMSFIEYHYLNRILSYWEENFGIDETLGLGSVVEKYSAWHYAMALVLLQMTGSLKSTIGKKANTIKQAMECFKVSEKFANNVYDSTKKMKNTFSNDDIGWDLIRFIKTSAPKYRAGYKNLVKKILNEDEKALEILNALPD